MKCILCGSQKFKKISSRTRDSLYWVVLCRDCALIQLSPTPTIKEDEEYYKKGLHLTTINEPTDLKTLRVKQYQDTQRRADIVSRFLKRGSTIADIGSGFGFFLQEMKTRGYKPTGIEISDFSRKISKKVTNAEVLDLNIMTDEPKRQFDVATLFHVFEHVNNPVELLKKVAKWVRKGGKIIAEVPNADDLLLQINKSYRDFYWQRPHVSYFSPKTLKLALKLAQLDSYKLSFYHRYGLENFMNWIILGKPQMQKPSYSLNGNYGWLEDYYKKTLVKKGWADTMMAVIKM